MRSMLVHASQGLGVLRLSFVVGAGAVRQTLPGRARFFVCATDDRMPERLPTTAERSATQKASEHIQENVDAIAAVYERAEQDMPRGQRGIESVVAALGRPRSLLLYLLVGSVWMGVNLVERRMGIEPLDPPPEVESALAAINTAHNQVSSDISLAQAGADQKIVQSKRAVEIETLKAQAEVQPLSQLAAELGSLYASGPQVLDAYLRTVRLRLYEKAKAVYLEAK